MQQRTFDAVPVLHTVQVFVGSGVPDEPGIVVPGWTLKIRLFLLTQMLGAEGRQFK